MLFPSVGGYMLKNTNKTTANTKTTPTPQQTKQNNDTQATHEHQKKKTNIIPRPLNKYPHTNSIYKHHTTPTRLIRSPNN